MKYLSKYCSTCINVVRQGFSSSLLNHGKGYPDSFIRRQSSFVTTPIFYVNSYPHIGHLYTALLADVCSRFDYLRDRGSSSSIFCTGTDEHGIKIEKAAPAAGYGENIKGHCDLVSASFLRMCKDFDVNYTDFIRTTENRHKVAVAHFWNNLYEKGHIYKCNYEGWYCVSDETFLRDFQVTDGVNPGNPQEKCKVSIESGHPVEWCVEENYMFKLQEFIPDVIKWIEKTNPIKPVKFQTLVIDWLKDQDKPFSDLSVSRPKARFTWGISVPNDPDQVIYVWLDALVNYLTVAGYPDEKYKNFWPPTVQVVGKDILKFHAIYWPAFLIANGLEPPRQILCHSHWTVDNVKMSKSLGNVVDPFMLKDKYGHETLRFFLISQGVPHSDGNFNEPKMIKMVNSALADTLGNLLRRCAAPALNPQKIWPEFNPEYLHLLSKTALTLKEQLEQLPDIIEQDYSEFNFYRGIEHILNVLRTANLYVQEEKPWEIVKVSPQSPKLLAMTSLVMETLRVVGIILWPIVPSLSTNLLDQLNVPPEHRLWNDLKPFIWERESTDKSLGPDQKVFFQRIKL